MRIVNRWGDCEFNRITKKSTFIVDYMISTSKIRVYSITIFENYFNIL